MYALPSGCGLRSTSAGVLFAELFGKDEVPQWCWYCPFEISPALAESQERCTNARRSGRLPIQSAGLLQKAFVHVLTTTARALASPGPLLGPAALHKGPPFQSLGAQQFLEEMAEGCDCLLISFEAIFLRGNVHPISRQFVRCAPSRVLFDSQRGQVHPFARQVGLRFDLKELNHVMSASNLSVVTLIRFTVQLYMNADRILAVVVQEKHNGRNKRGAHTMKIFRTVKIGCSWFEEWILVP